MALLLAPYNDSMRLGMGFNSYTQTLCIDNAVQVRHKELVRADNPSQVVTYSSKLVEHLSDVVSSLNVSHSASIRKGTVEIAGNGDSINEDKIKSSDINAVVSVKVVNQTLIVKDDAEFCAMYDVMPGTQRFNDTFGDCYISGFITGGEFNGIISMRVIDRSKTASVTSAIKKGLRSAKGAKEFSLDMDSSSSESINSEVLKDTETTITVSWMGGGQVKDPRTSWTLESVYAAADAFPMLVSKCPQKTWAILTKYKANRSFVDQTRALAFSPLEYDLVAGYTSTLFDNYMEYKQLIKNVQDMMANPDNYKVRTKSGTDFDNYIPLDVDTLVAARSAFRIEMNKIVQAVDILSKDPHALKKSGKLTAEPSDAKILKIIRNATKKSTDSKKNAFWNYEKAADPVLPPAGRYQWVYVTTEDRLEVQNAADAANSQRSDRGKLYFAWVENDASKVLNRNVRPEEVDSNLPKDCWKQAWITEFLDDKLSSGNDEAKSSDLANAKGSWEWGWVDFVASSLAQDQVSSAKAYDAAASKVPDVDDANSSDSGNAIPTPSSSSASNQRVYTTQSVGQGPTQPVPAQYAPAPQSQYGMYQNPYQPQPAYSPWAYAPPPVNYPGYGYPGYGPPPMYPTYPGYALPPQTASGSGPAQDSAKSTLAAGEKSAGTAQNGASGATPVKDSTQQGGSKNDAAKDSAVGAAAEQPRLIEHRMPYAENKVPDLDFDIMISPEIWANLLPLAVEDAPPAAAATASVMPESLSNAFPTAPTDDLADIRKRTAKQAAQKLEILSAACGVVDCTDDLRDMVQPDGTLTIDTRSIQSLMAGHSAPQPLKPQETYLSFVFRYADQPMQLFVNSPSAANQIYTVSPSSKDYPIVTPSTWNETTWSTLAIVYGGKQFTDPAVVSNVFAAIKKNYDDGKGTRHVNMNSDVMKEDPLKGWCKTGIIFYQIRPGGQVRCAVGVEDRTPCMLTDRLLPDVLDPYAKTAADKTHKDYEDAKNKAQQDHEKAIKTWEDNYNAAIKQYQDIQTTNEAEISKLKKSLEAQNQSWKTIMINTVQNTEYKPRDKANNDNIPSDWDLVGEAQVRNLQDRNPSRAMSSWPSSQQQWALKPSEWDGRKIQLLYKRTGTVVDFGPEDVYLYQTALFAHDNQTITLMKFGPDNAHYWMLLTKTGALAMESNKVVRRKADPRDIRQWWYITRGSDPFSIRIRTVQWDDCYVQINSPTDTALIGKGIPTGDNEPLYNWQVLVVADPPPPEVQRPVLVPTTAAKPISFAKRIDLEDI